MQPQKTVQGTPMIVSLILILASVVLSIVVFILAFRDLLVLTGTCISLAALMAALLYIFRGGTKHAAKYLLTFKILFCLSSLAITVQAAVQWNPLSGILCLLCLIMLVVLTVVKNLGESHSLNLCALIGVLKLVVMVLAIFPTPGVRGAEATGLVPFLRNFAEFSMVVTLFACTYVKYRDKRARGREV